MVQTKPSKSTAQIGEEIGLELGTQMIASYRQSNPTDVIGHLVGRNILEQILAQPGCAGIKFYNAYNEVGAKTLVYVGVDATGADMLQITSVSANGNFTAQTAIVGDRVKELEDLGWWDF